MNGMKENGPIIPGEKNELDQGVTPSNLNSPLMFSRWTSIELVVNQLLKLKKNTYIILGLSKDKEIDSIVSLFPKKFRYYLCGSYNSRILESSKLSEYFNQNNLNCEVFDFVFEAYDSLLTKTEENDVICILGSTFIVSDLLKYLDKA